MLDRTSILLQVVGSPYSAAGIIENIEQLWTLSQPFRVNRVESQTYIVEFWSEVDFQLVLSNKWFWFDNDIVLTQPWHLQIDTTEDPLSSIPQIVGLHNIPQHLLGG